MKSTDVAPELRVFNKAFNKVANGRWDEGDVFRDFLDYVLYCLNTGRTEAHIREYEAMKAKYGEQYEHFPEMLHELLQVYHKQIGEDSGPGAWYDPLGDFYMELASRGKQSHFGQFFTPKPVCDMMTQMNVPEGAYGKGLKASDCACGSGRTLLSFHAHAVGNFVYGDDLDSMCVAMTAINMAFHGCVGQVRRMDSLRMEFYYGYAVNPSLTRLGVVSIHPLQGVNDEMWLWAQPNWIERLARERTEAVANTETVTHSTPTVEPVTATVVADTATVEKRKAVPGVQLKIF